MKAKTKKDEKQILKDAVKNVEAWYTYYSSNIDKFKDLSRFLYDEDGQWNTTEIEEYRRRRKVRLTVNQCKAYVDHLIGEFRENTPALQVRTKGESEIVDQKDVDLTEQLLRTHIDNKKARICFQTAYENALCGYGAIEVSTDYEHDESFYQTLKINEVKNPLKAGFDPSAIDCTKSEGDFSFLYKRMSKASFKRKYPGIDYEDFSKVETVNSGVFDWGNKDEITVLKYAYKEYYKKEIVQISDGTNTKIVNTDEVDEILRKSKKNAKLQTQATGSSVEPMREVQRRTVDSYKIYVCKMIKDKILEGKKLWKPSIMPFLYVDGDSYIDLDTDRQTIRPFVQDAKGPAKAANFAFSENANALKRSQYHKKFITPQQIEGHEQYYKGSNASDVYLYNWISSQAPPIDSPPTAPSPAYLQSFDSASQALRFVVGMHDATIGKQGLERSGKALGHEIRQGNTGNFSTIDNLYRTMEVVGNLILELFPVLYDTTRTVMLTSADGQMRPKTLNKPSGFTNDGDQQYENDMRGKKYAVCIEPGAPFALQKKEALDSLLSFVQASPQLGAVIPDLIAENIDIKNGPQLVKRAKTLLPPAIVAEESGQPPPPQKPDPQLLLEQQKINNEQTKMQLEARKMEQDSQVNTVKSSTELQKAGMELHAKQLQSITDKNARINEHLAKQNDDLKEIVGHLTGQRI